MSSESKTDIERYRTRLRALQSELAEVRDSGDAAAGTVELDQTRQGRLSRMDALQAQAMSVEAQRRRERQLTGIAAALARIDAGEYGACTACGEAIDPRRLDHDPAAAWCIACAESAESQ